MIFLFSLLTLVHADQIDTGKAAIRSMTGCYLVDYSYTETESLKPGYVRDNRVYDVNKDKSIKEWIYAEDLSANHIRLQHILFATDLNGNFISESVLRHQAEDWEYSAPYLFDFVAPLTWTPRVPETNTWTRRITNLDDGLRYQCASTWNMETNYPEWKCDNYAPIPGRETRDMGRKDYNTLARSTRIVAYGNSWLERQENIKTIHENNTRTPLAKELGKNWYVRLPDSECSPVQNFVQERQEFWTLLRRVWDLTLTLTAFSEKNFVETVPVGAPPRFAKMMEIEARYYNKDLSVPEISYAASDEIKKVIEAYRIQ